MNNFNCDSDNSVIIVNTCNTTNSITFDNKSDKLKFKQTHTPVPPITSIITILTTTTRDTLLKPKSFYKTIN